ncbi:hypothetical protein ACP2X5_05915 [Leuconostoc mesenteroides subsp. jonggajibkimchii]|uniref:hypothetical protein n=1 Tax=Leuconostoc mesenteroides TaxID=1245 RepID=UPI003CF57413
MELINFDERIVKFSQIWNTYVTQNIQAQKMDSSDYNHETLPEIVARSAFRQSHDIVKLKSVTTEEQLIYLVILTEKIKEGTEAIRNYLIESCKIRVDFDHEVEVFESKKLFEIYNSKNDKLFFETIRSVVYAHSNSMWSNYYAEFIRFQNPSCENQEAPVGTPKKIFGNSFLYCIRETNLDKFSFQVNFQVFPTEIFQYFEVLLNRFDLFSQAIKNNIEF